MFEGPHYTYKVASVDRVVDGDTIDVTVDLGFNVFTKQRLRLSYIDAPELKGGTAETKEKAKKVVDRVNDLLSSGDIFIVTENDKTGKYGHYLAKFIVVKQGIDFVVNDILLEEGLAEKYTR